jgi:hypothetical protein
MNRKIIESNFFVISRFKKRREEKLRDSSTPFQFALDYVKSKQYKFKYINIRYIEPYAHSDIKIRNYLKILRNYLNILKNQQMMERLIYYYALLNLIVP